MCGRGGGLKQSLKLPINNGRVELTIPTFIKTVIKPTLVDGM